jgi:hypothetical protein
VNYSDEDLNQISQADLSCSLTTEVSEFVDRSPNLHPNPGTDHFTLQFPPGQHDLTIFDPQGQLVFQQKVSGDDR